MHRINGMSKCIRRSFFNSTKWRTEEKIEVTKQKDLTSKREIIAPKPSSTVPPAPKPSENAAVNPNLKKILSTTLPPIQELPLSELPPTSADIKSVAVAKEQELQMATPFDEMPGPEILKILARGWSYLPQFSNQFTTAAMVYFMNMLGRTDDVHSVGGASLVWNRGVSPFLHMFDKYGPVVRLQGIFGGDIVFVARPEHIEAVYKEEGKYPLRSTLDSLERYRQLHRKESIAGPFVLGGPDWESVRSKMEVPFMKSVSQFGPHVEVIADEFMGNLRDLLNRQDETPPDFDKEIFKWSFESVALITLGKRLHLVGQEKLLPGSVGSNLFEAMLSASVALRKCESGFQMWRLVNTPSWNNLLTSCELIDGIVLKFIRETENRLQLERFGFSPDAALSTEARKREPSAQVETDPHRPVPLLESLLLDGGMSHEDILTVVLDMLLLGANATAHAISFLLYRMAKAPYVQRTLHKELQLVMPEQGSELSPLIKGSGLQNLSYLKACLRESLRMNPPIPVLTRYLPKDIAIHNYRIPSGTLVLMTTHVAGLKEENFEDAQKFKPERWLDAQSHPFASLPYGHGPRSCVARHLADIQILFLAAKIFRTYYVEYNYGTIHPTNRLIAMPNKPLKFRFIERL